MSLADTPTGATGLRPRTRQVAERYAPFLPCAVLAIVMAIAAAVIMHGGRSTTFFYDDWNFATLRLGWRPYILLYPHNEHLSLLPVVIYKVLLETVGMDHYGVFRAVSVGFNLTCGLLFFLYLRRRLGDWPAVALAACLMLMGAAAYDLIWPFQIGYMGSIAAGLGALLALDRGTRRGDIAACILTAVSLSSSSVGLPVLAAIALDVLLRPDRRRRWWIFVIPAALYGLWYLKYGVGTAKLANIPHIPGEIWGGLTVSLTAITGLPGDYGGALALALIVFVVLEINRADLNLRLLTAAALPLTFWTLAALARSDLPPSEARYLYPTGLFVALVAAEALWRYRPAGRIALAVTVLLGLGALGSSQNINAYGDSWRNNSLNSKASLSAADILGPKLVRPDAHPDPGQPQLFYGRYRAAVEAYGSTPAWTPDEVLERSDGERTAVDNFLIGLIGPVGVNSPRPATGCGPRRGDGADTETQLPTGRLFVEPTTAPVELRFRRFGSGYAKDPQGTIPPRARAAVAFPEDNSGAPWIVATRSAAPYTVCAGF